MLDIILAIENEDERNTAEWIWNRFRKHMYRIAFKILQTRADAEDALMDAIRNVVANIKKFEGLTELDIACLVSIYAKNASLKIYNKNKRTRELVVDDEDLQITDTKTNVEDIVIKKEEYELFAKYLRNMSEIYSHPFILRHYYEYSIQDIMQTLNLSEAAVKKRLVRAKQQLIMMARNDYE